MLLLFHIAVALGSIAFTGYSVFSPSRSKIQVSYGLIALTLASGTYLVISTHAAMLQACTTGLAYLAIVLCELFAVHARLVKATNK